VKSTHNTSNINSFPTRRSYDLKKKLSYKEQKEWNGIEDEIMELESNIEEIQTGIADAGSDLEKVQNLYKEQQEVEAALEAKMERWEELSLLVEEIENSK